MKILTTKPTKKKKKRPPTRAQREAKRLNLSASQLAVKKAEGMVDRAVELAKLQPQAQVSYKNQQICLRESIMDAFRAVGGHEYLVAMAREDRKTFASLLAKVIPQEIRIESNSPALIHLMSDEQLESYISATLPSLGNGPTIEVEGCRIPRPVVELTPHMTRSVPAFSLVDSVEQPEGLEAEER